MSPRWRTACYAPASMILLLLSLSALAMGPFLARGLKTRPALASFCDGFVVLGVLALTAAHIIPHAIVWVGPWALVAWLAGIVLPAMLHGVADPCHHRPVGAMLIFAVVALGLHALLDGVALVAQPFSEGDKAGALSLGLAVVLHRLLEGLSVWWLTRRAPVRWRVCALLGVGLATSAGYWLGWAAIFAGWAGPISLVQVSAAGSLLHVLARHPGDAAPMTQTAKGRMASSLGACLALAVTLGLGEPEPHGAHGHGEAQDHILHAHGPVSFLTGTSLGQALLLAVGITLLLSLLWVAIEHAVGLASESSGPPRRDSSPLTHAWRGALAGLLTPLCACGAIPLYLERRARRFKDSDATAFLLAAPAIGPTSLFLSLWLLGWQMTLARTLMALGLALVAGLWASQTQTACPTEPATAQAPALQTPRQWRGQLADGLAFAWGDVLTFAAPWLVFGLTLAALIADIIQADWLHALNAWHIAPWVFVILAAPFYICAAASTLLAAILAHKGATDGSLLAFLSVSSAVGLGATSQLRELMGRRKAFALVGLLLALVGLAASGVDFVDAEMLRDLSYQFWAVPAAIKSIAAIGVIAVFWGVFRQGVRGALNQVAAPNRALTSGHHHHD